jgi:hypothetical protein
VDRDRPNGLPSALATSSMTLNCYIDLDKESGLTLTVKDLLGTVTQTVEMNGTKIIITVKGLTSTSTITQSEDTLELKLAGPAQNSTVTQKADSVVVKCSNFEVDADAITLKSMADTSVSATQNLKLSSTQNMELSSTQKLTASSVQDMSLSATQGLSMSATGDAQLTGQNVSVSGLVKASLAGNTEVAISGLKVAVKGDTQVDVTAPITNLGETMTSVKGQLVKIEGALIKLG